MTVGTMEARETVFAKAHVVQYAYAPSLRVTADQIEQAQKGFLTLAGEVSKIDYSLIKTLAKAETGRCMN